MDTITTSVARGRGRPRIKPEGATERKVWLTDAQAATVADRAAIAGVSSTEWLRQLVLVEIAKPRPFAHWLPHRFQWTRVYDPRDDEEADAEDEE